MTESGGVGRMEPLLHEEVPNTSWRLNVKEFHLPNQTVDDLQQQQQQQNRSFSFNSLLRKPS